MNYFQQHAQVIITWSGFALLLGVALLFAFPALKARIRQQILLRRITRLGDAALHHVVLPDGLGGEILIDHLLLNANGITVVKVQRYDGIVFAAENIENWTQVLGKRSYKFPNPLPDLDASLAAIRVLVADVAVRAYLLVLQGAQFPKGRPQNVLLLSEAQALLASADNGGAALPVEYAAAWQILLSTAQPLSRNAASGSKHLQGEDTSPRGWLAASLMLLLAAGWLAWRLTA